MKGTLFQSSKADGGRRKIGMIFPDVRTVLDSGVLVVNILVMLTVGMAVLRGGRAAVRTQTAGPGGNRT